MLQEAMYGAKGVIHVGVFICSIIMMAMFVIQALK